MVDFKRELCSEIIQEITPLLSLHYEEISKHKDIPLAPDFDVYLQAEQAGIIRIYTARLEGKLIGYGVFYLRPHPHYRNSVQANATLLFIDPSHRGFGMSFIRFCDEALAEDGCDAVTHTVTTQLDYSALLKRMGYEPVELIFQKRLYHG